MDSGLKEVTFIFENCDSITIDGKYVGEFLVDDIKTSFERMACNYIGKCETANTFVIEIHKDANKERCALGVEEWKQMTFDRFGGCDIASIEFELEGKRYSYYVNWTGDDDCLNDAQSNYISKLDNLYVVIAENKKVEDVFDLEEINDSDYMDFYFDMNDVGDKYSNPNRYNEAEDDEQCM